MLISEFFRMFKDSVSRLIDQFGRKRSVKMCATNIYKSFFQDILLYTVHERWAVKSSFITYVCHGPDFFIALSWTVLYIYQYFEIKVADV